MKIHFIGIGGIGVSALAQYYLKTGHNISGSDLTSSETVKYLEKIGAKILIGHHKPSNVPKETEKVIYSPAIQENNLELKYSRKKGIEAVSYPQVLGELTKKYYTIAVSGAHGKSTTTALVGILLANAGFDPTVIVGTKVKEFNNSNCRVGKSKYLVIEADEWKASFLNYWPKIIVLTNIEKEHLDYYKDLSHIIRTFKEYLMHLPENGIIIANKDDKNIYRIVHNIRDKYPIQINWYYFRQTEAEIIKKYIKIPGQHNIYNALAVLQVSRELKISDKIFYKSISDYIGAWRRFEIIKNKPITIISDYGHHPTEIKATISGAREKYGKRKIWVIFQPHQRQRTYFLFNQFVKAFDEADELILSEIYDVAGREQVDISRKISSIDLTRSIQNRGKTVHFVKNFNNIPSFVKPKLKTGDVVLLMGAGDIYKIADKLAN